ncbi:MAG TPA: type II toxin-antitoxin system RelE/ParE family toxin [Thermoanaerobaculia bacterium]|nr:type II toxin-antitoxin system RelE/ParE family toxin [Thermoanaerobaculia bacterium]
MAWRVRWSGPAWDNVQAAAGYIAFDSPRYAAALVRDARDAARSLRQFPRRGRVVPEEGNPSIRELFVFHQRYRMLYEIVDETGEVIILAFIHGARDLETALDEND